ncbi:MAG: Tex family protein [Planctomycetia bacterium]|nr:Tex family protein [Planctomycetia bacterium]
MTDLMQVNLRQVARGMSIPLKQVEAVVQLHDEGNTVPFITRYRKDETGGLDEVQIRQILTRLNKLRQLLDRKQTILRSIESQGQLTPDLEEKLKAATTVKRLEDLYIPFKPKKQTLATLARKRGLEPLAMEILQNACEDLNARAAEFVDPEKELNSVEEVLAGTGHILAEKYSENAELRQKLREIFLRTAKILTTRIPPAPVSAEDEVKEVVSEETVVAEAPEVEISEDIAVEIVEEVPEVAETAEEVAENPVTAEESAESTESAETTSEEATAEASEEAKKAARAAAKAKAKAQKAQRRQKEEERRQKAFQDYFEFEEQVRKIPPHRVLAINRGEHGKILRVKLDADQEALTKCAEETLLSADMPHQEFLRGCIRDALGRLILPALERETRRELTETAETHAVDVFAKNLRNLLLQPPIHEHRVLAMDPGFKNGCKLAALDQFGNFLEHAVIYLIGKKERLEEAKKTILQFIEKYHITLIAIGNGTASRTTEDFVAKLLTEDLAGKDVAYVVVNEAGASVYSTSVLGREEFPEYDATLRGAISIGRRLQDPLSELVKIDPANIGVGLYQHDVKAKHLRESLEGVVESCVNFVGVDVNTASPALLRFVSGLNQLHGRKIYEYRRQHGPFRNREELRAVPGIGEATYVQAAGFLKIGRGDNPLDATWIHPESYALATRILEKLEISVEELRHLPQEWEAKIAALDIPSLAEELGTGEWKLRDILTQLARPGRDPREDLPRPIFRKGVMKLEDLSPGMELTGTILNVVDFGAFVDIGLHESGLVHVSQIADHYVRDPHDAIAVGDIVKTWVVSVDKERRRVSLTMIDPARTVEPSAPQAGAKEKERKRKPAKPAKKPPVPVAKPGPEVAAVLAPPKSFGLRLVQEAPADFVPKTAMSTPKERKPQAPAAKQEREEKRSNRAALPKYQYRKDVVKPAAELSEEVKKGKAPMRGFDELAAFLKQSDAK